MNYRRNFARAALTLACTMGGIAGGIEATAVAAAKSAKPLKDACAALTAAQVSAALGVDVDAGAHFSAAEPNTCVWRASGHPTGVAPSVILFVLDAARFDQLKTGRHPVMAQEGVGDQAFFFPPRVAPVALVVKKGESYFQLIARTQPASAAAAQTGRNPGEAPRGGTPVVEPAAAAGDQSKTVEIALAREILTKL